VLKNIFSKTLHDHRRLLLVWAIGMFILTLVLVLLFPSIREAAGTGTILGDTQLFNNYIARVVLSYALILPMSLAVLLGFNLANEEKHNKLQSILVQKVTRKGVYLQKVLAFIIIVALVCLAFLLGILFGSVLIGQTIDYTQYLEVAAMLLLALTTIVIISFSLGAMFGKHIGIISFIIYLAISYILTLIAAGSSLTNFLAGFSFFSYIRLDLVLINGFNFINIGILSALAIIFLIVGLVIFKNRDINFRK
jgi:putative exporter of polyketide antibiotics